MNTHLWWQYVLIAVAVIASCIATVRKLAPVWIARRLSAISASLTAPRHGAFAHWLGNRLRPASDAAKHCGDGCAMCGQCGTAAPPATHHHPGSWYATPVRSPEHSLDKPDEVTRANRQ